MSGTSGWGRACTGWRPLTSRQTPHGSGAAFDDARHPVHQDLLARRRHPSHTGADEGAAPTTGRAVLLGGGGGVCTARANSSCRLRVISVASRRWRGTPLAPSTWRDIASFGRAVLARRYDDTRSAWRCEYWFLRRPERRSHARGQVPRYEKERSLGANTIR